MARPPVATFRKRRGLGDPFVCLTAYDAPTARIVARAGVDLILVGDSVGNVVLGEEDPTSVTMDQMVHHSAAVRRGAPDAFVVADMPFLAAQVSDDEAIRNAGRLIQEGRADAVKIEGGLERAATIEAVTNAGIAVCGHIGLMPQSASTDIGFKARGRTAASATRLEQDARSVAAAGAFGVVLECVAVEASRRITDMLPIPTIGIGSGPHCSAQIAVVHDILGFEGRFAPRFVRKYADIERAMTDAIEHYAKDVRDGDYPNASESFPMKEGEAARYEERPDS